MDQVTRSSAIASVGVPTQYWAFISYSRHDEAWAKKLHGFLETYRIPRDLVGRTIDDRVIPRRLLPIFRDRDELAGGSDLDARISDALAASHSLVVICSPYAAASKWVDREIARFKSIGRSKRIFPLIVAGEPFASENPDANLPECFPRSLRFKLDPDGAVTTERSEPLAADARDGKDGWKNCVPQVDCRNSGRAVRRAPPARTRAAAKAAARFVPRWPRWLRLLVGASYVGLADADLAIPQGEEIRRTLDHYGLSLLRPVPAAADLRVLPRARAPRSAAGSSPMRARAGPNGPAPRMPGRPDKFSPPWFAIARPPLRI